MLFNLSLSFSLLNDFKVSEEFERIEPSLICKAPKYRPYLTVTRVTRTEIEFNVTDLNEESLVDGYLLIYWGFRLGPKSSYRFEDRHFGRANFTKGRLCLRKSSESLIQRAIHLHSPSPISFTEGPFVITNLRPYFSYCADLASINTKCGSIIHGPFCMGCFEQVLTL